VVHTKKSPGDHAARSLQRGPYSSLKKTLAIIFYPWGIERINSLVRGGVSTQPFGCFSTLVEEVPKCPSRKKTNCRKESSTAISNPLPGGSLFFACCPQRRHRHLACLGTLLKERGTGLKKRGTGKKKPSQHFPQKKKPNNRKRVALGKKSKVCVAANVPQINKNPICLRSAPSEAQGWFGRGGRGKGRIGQGFWGPIATDRCSAQTADPQAGGRSEPRQPHGGAMPEKRNNAKNFHESRKKGSRGKGQHERRLTESPRRVPAMRPADNERNNAPGSQQCCLTKSP